MILISERLVLDNLENRTFEYNLPINSIAEGVNQVRLQSVGTGNDLSLVDSISRDLSAALYGG